MNEWHAIDKTSTAKPQFRSRGAGATIKALAVALTALTVSLGASSTAQAVEILPVSYSFDKTTDTGSYAYHDWTGEQLIDGQYGAAPWSADLGNGNAYEWVGWVHDTPVNIDFDFGAITGIDSIAVGTVQDHVNDVVVPSIEIYSSSDGSSWSLEDSLDNSPESSLNDNQYFTFTLGNLGLNTRHVRVRLLHAGNGPWTFTDEIDFYADVPEPTTLAILGLGLAGIGFSRRKRLS